MIRKPGTSTGATFLSGSWAGGPADHQWLNLYFDHEYLALVGAVDDRTVVSGHQDYVSFIWCGPQTLVDSGQGTSIEVCGNSQVTVTGFQNDPTATIRLPYETVAPVVQSDLLGGTLITTGNGGGIRLVGTTIAASQIVSSVPPRMAFIAAQPQAATAADQVIVVSQDDQYLPLENVSNTTVVDHGHNLVVQLIGNSHISIEDFASDQGAHVIFGNGPSSVVTWANDGHGGTLVVADNGCSCDFIGVQLDAKRQMGWAAGHTWLDAPVSVQALAPAPGFT